MPKKVRNHHEKAAVANASVRSINDQSFADKIKEHNSKASAGHLGHAAKTAHEEWASAGKQDGIQIWRVEKFHIVSWPKEQYGKFYDGDSYLVLKTTKKDDGTFKWDIHFWLGSGTSQDEAGTAAYKTVELDDTLGGAPVQHREVQDHESDLFKSYFKPAIQILNGGIESGFNHVKPEEYKPRLLLVGGTQKVVHVKQVELSAASLNSHDAGVLDNGLQIWHWNGSHAHIREKNKAGELARAIESEREGRAVVTVLDEGSEDGDFWAALGGKGAVNQTEQGEEEGFGGVRSLYQLNLSGGQSSFSEKASGKVTKNLFDSHEVFLFDNGFEVFVWVGRSASGEEKKLALIRAQDYLQQHNRPAYLSITRESDGNETATFIEALDH